MEWETFKANKKKRLNLSLSRTRLKKQKLEDSSKKSCCVEMATTTTAVKQELMLAADPVNVKTEQSTQTILNVESITKNEKNTTLSCQKSIKSETLTDSSSLPLNFESIKLEENGLLSQQPTLEKEEEENKEVVKSEPESTREPWLSYQHCNYDSLKKEEEEEDKKKIKAEIKAEEESKREEELSYITKPEHIVSYKDDMDTAPMPLESSSSEYHCPICNMQLASSNNLRQRHIDKCLDEQEEKERERTNNNLEFNQCFICSKDLSRFSAEQREIHLNRCLDLKQAQEKRIKDSTFAGQTIPSIDSLEQCPICHSGFTKAQPLKIKVSHLKQCSRKNNISAEVLKQKCRWIEWGHLEQQQQQQQQQQQLSTSQGKSTHVPSHFYMTDTHNDDFGHVDDDFSEKVIIHRVVSNKKVERELDKQDEELQTALAMSFSLQEQKKKPSKKRQLIEPDSADIWTPEESKVNSLERLSQLALKKKPASIYGIRLNHSSRLQSHSGRISLWKLASLRQQQQQQEEEAGEEGLCYLSLFLRELYNKQNNKRINK